MKNEDLSTRVALDSLGCKLNQAETEFLAKQLAEAGYRLVSPSDEADIYILNTCTVTRTADSKSRHLLRLVHRRSPHARLIVTGCYAQRDPHKLAQIEGVDLVLGNDEKPSLLQLLGASSHLSKRGCVPRDAVSYHNADSRTRALVKIQDGCNDFCAYCIVPLVRGREASTPADQVVAEVRHLIAVGYQEVVLTGVKIGSYQSDGFNLKGLIEHILAETEVKRLRLSSLQPQEISPELIGLWCDRRLCRHFHFSLQSGSDAVLKRMKRHYTTTDYQRAVSLIRTLVPGAAITTDIMVGFPGETSAEFEQSYNFCRQLGFARIHVFTYSPRPGTQAAKMPDQVADRIKKERCQQMLAQAEASARSFSQRFCGKTIPVLWEKRSNGLWSGLTDNYIRVYTKNNEDLANKLLPVKLAEVYEDGVWGEVK